MKGSTSELLMGWMLHEVSGEIVSLVLENTKNHTNSNEYKLNDPKATQGTNRVIINGIDLTQKFGQVVTLVS